MAGLMQLTLLAFGIAAGIGAIGVPAREVFSGSGKLLGEWAPWLGVLVFAVGVMIANSAPTRSFYGLLIVLYVAWTGQVLGNVIFGGYVSALVGAMVMTPTAVWVSRLPSAMPPIASFLPGFWLLVPGALGLIGLAKLAGTPNSAGTQDLVATAVSIFAVAVGVLCGTLLLEAAAATRKVAEPLADRTVVAAKAEEAIIPFEVERPVLDLSNPGVKGRLLTGPTVDTADSELQILRDAFKRSPRCALTR